MASRIVGKFAAEQIMTKPGLGVTVVASSSSAALAAELQVTGCGRDAITSATIGEGHGFEVAVVLGDSSYCLCKVIQLRGGGFRGPIIASTPESNSTDAELLRTAGANYMANPSAHAIIECLKKVDGTGAPSPAESLHFSMHPNTRRVQIGSHHVVLSPAQFSILACLSERFGTWKAAGTIISQALMTNHSPTSSLVRVHVNAIRKKLGIAQWCLQSERTFGYLFLTNPDLLPSVGSQKPRFPNTQRIPGD